MTPAEVCRLGELNEGYLSTLISGEANPRLSYLHKIARVLGISVSTMLRPPPDQALVDHFSGLDPAVIARLQRGPTPEK
jgi:transcriptional regulator with XRE-family HTH domain